MLFSLLMVLCAAPRCFAQVHNTATWPEAVSQADTICLGTITKTEIETVGRGVSEFSIATVHVNVIAVLKGTAAQKQITISDWHLSRVDIPTNKYVVFFLKDWGGSDYALLDGWEGSLTALGNEPPLPLLPGLTPFRATGLLMANTLAHADHERRWELLLRIRQGLLIDRPVDPYFVKVATQVGEPKGAHEFLERQIVPLVKPYVHDSDKDTARVAQLVVAHRL